MKYWFTKVKQWDDHQGQILGSTISPDGQYVGTVSSDETLRVWKMFERFQDLEQEETKQETGMSEAVSQIKKQNSKKMFERQDAILLERSLNQAQDTFKVHSTIDLKEEIHEVKSMFNNEGLSQNSVR
eukprot:403373528